MALYNLPNNTTSFDGMLTQMTTGSFAWLTPMLLFFTFIVIFMGGSSRQLIKTGRADYSAWSVVASLTILLMALFLSVSRGFIDVTWLIVVVFINIFSYSWFAFDRKSSEI